MIRRVVGFHQDEEGDWVAELSCLHNQHVRHQPPFVERPWVQTASGRAAAVGGEIECPLCDRAELPDRLSTVHTAGPFDADSLPPGLRRTHRIADGTWGCLRVLDGETVLTMETNPPISVSLKAGEGHPIPPGVPHTLSIDGPVSLTVDFLTRDESHLSGSDPPNGVSSATVSSSSAPDMPSGGDSTVRGWQLYKAGQVDGARATFDTILAATPEDYSAVLGRGRCQRHLGAYQEAIADFTKAHELRPRAARPLFERGAISILIERYDEALTDYEAAAILEPAYPGVASYFAELYLYTGRAQRALVLSERASRDEPTNLVHRINIAHARLLLGETERANHAYDAIADLHDPGKGITGAAIALQDLAQMRSAGIEPPGMVSIERRLKKR
jgi:Flp pilus assembly protein TadD